MTYRFSIAIGGKLAKFSHNEKSILMDRIKTHLKLNNINYSDDDLSKMIDRQSKLKTAPIRKGVSFSSAMQGAKALLRYTAGNSASDQEIIRRSAICETCPKISKVNNCMGCGASGRIAAATNAIRTLKKTQIAIPSTIKTMYCGICDCSLPLMVVTKYTDFYTEDPSKNMMRPDRCWLKTTSTNFTNE